MSRISTLKTAAKTLAVALGVGLVMQLGVDPATSEDTAPTVDRSAVRTLMMSTNAQGEAVFGVPDVVTTPLPHAQNVQAVVAVDIVYTEFAVPQMGTILATPIEGCAATLDATAAPAAMVSLTLSAPCTADQDLVLRHEGLQITARTDSSGTADFLVPALAVNAEFSVLFENVEHARTALEVPDMRLYDRTVLQWAGRYNLQLHALEAGASIGDPDHVWSASMHSASDAIAGTHGFVTRLGSVNVDLPYLAEIYTYPAGRGKAVADTVLQIGVAVTEQNCGREVDTIVIESRAGESVVSHGLAAALPDCSAVGEVAILPDHFQGGTLTSH
ncbi:hypothetical protein [Yoonia sp. BS5-3]|uniref:Uncharacterized protein n=1 Tax=Yoonia phaeophyticola TaxID=3137369 RepID=A0ABZ2V6I7_9RHOB